VKRVFIIPLSFILMVGMACTLGQSMAKRAPTSLPPTDAATLAESPTSVEMPTEITLPTDAGAVTPLAKPTLVQPTEPEAATQAPEATETAAATLPSEATATSAPSATLPAAPTPEKGSPTQAPSGPTSGEYFTEKFSGSTSDFTRWVTVGNPKSHFGEIMDGLLKFSLPAMDTYAYATRNGYSYSDVYVQAVGSLVTGSNAGLAVVCRVSDAGWDEFRISTRGLFAGSYEVYRYDKSLVAQHKVPYINLLTADRINTLDIKTGTQKNTIGLSCVGQDLRVYINGVEQTKHNKQLLDKVLTSGSVGVGVIGYYSTASTVQFESLETQKPQ
jgi:hypothetical protein